MEALLWILLPGFVAVASGLLVVVHHAIAHGGGAGRSNASAWPRSRGALDAERTAVRDSLDIAVHAAEERAQRQALDTFLSELRWSSATIPAKIAC